MPCWKAFRGPNFRSVDFLRIRDHFLALHPTGATEGYLYAYRHFYLALELLPHSDSNSYDALKHVLVSWTLRKCP